MQKDGIEMITDTTCSKLLAIAEKLIEDAPKAEMSQAIVFITREAKTYAYFTCLADYSAKEDQIVETLSREKDTAVSCLIAMWETGCIDVPSYSFREKLVALDLRNRETKLILQGTDGLVMQKIGNTLCQR